MDEPLSKHSSDNKREKQIVKNDQPLKYNREE